MNETSFVIEIGCGPDDELEYEIILSQMNEKLPAEANVQLLFPSFSDENNHSPVESGVLDYVRSEMSPKDYTFLGRKNNDVKGITYADMYRIGKPIPRGGGLNLGQFIIDLISTDTAVQIAFLTTLMNITKQLIKTYITKDEARSITIRHGKNEIKISGFSKKDTDKIIDGFFSKIRKII